MQTCENGRDCPCTAACPRHGKCCACVEHHNKKGQFPACFFSEAAEKDMDRSLERLLADRGVTKGA